MSVRNHRIVAVSILTAGAIVLLAWGRSLAVDSDDVREVRDKLQGTWVASLIQAGENRKAVGPAAERCRVEFDGKKVSLFHLIDGFDGRGTYLLDPTASPPRVDFKLDIGWTLGIYELDNDTLKVCVNPFAMPERLGAPNRLRPAHFRTGEDRHLYIFRRAKPEP